MLFTDYLETLAPPTRTTAEDRAMRGSPDRDPLSTAAGRTMAARSVATAERFIGARIDISEDAWPGVVSTLAGYGADDWMRLRRERAKMLGLKEPKSRSPRRPRKKADTD